MSKSYAERCDDLEAAERRKGPYKSWGPGAFMPPVFAEPETAAERMALSIVQGKYPRAIAISGFRCRTCHVAACRRALPPQPPQPPRTP